MTILVFAAPFLLLILAALICSGISIFRSFRRRQRPRLPVILAFLAGLLVLDAVASLVITINAGLSHSEAAKAAASTYCIILFVLLVVLPALFLFILFRRSTSNTHSQSQ